ncbi:NAD(P)/FAD-dependent oxidoreductase [Salinisphaera sp.]|uniref:NAD(P)/FAD-dependent oxidoreductase n=1 Tax=Salinisphaera sp. TaxID=1914330 RepID=UPI002D7903C6|nr:NAD(P)/FAD-dependent oxidoreductase [Salinisphaera sp.]HET7314433.1 NAD(P)/FAD-dependent oxidoreductase [Salinisphaera sp.]
MTQAIDTEVIVLGGGAAGLMCAAVAGARGRRVQVLEKTRRVGKKILMSGGGRCNFTNLYSEPDNFLSANPHYCKSALARYTPADFIGLVEAHGIAYHEKERGQLFCDGSSKQIVRLLLDECERAGVAVHTEIDIRHVEREAGDRFRVETGAGVWRGEAVVIATGGLSIPKMGASGFGFDLARRYGLGVREPRPALVPFTLAARERTPFVELSGLGLEVEARCNGMSFDAGMLFTHRGLSGPAMLQVSSYWRAGDAVGVDFLPGVDARGWLRERRAQRPNARLSSVLAERLPKRLAVCLCRDAGAARLGDPRLKTLSDDELGALGAGLADWRFVPEDTEGYRTAEVTIGGVDTEGLSSSTMAARDVPGLYFIGEVVDVTGHLGGHNFQWAWASANAAGQVV